MKPEISRHISCQQKTEFPIVWADLFTGVRSDASRFIPADISAAEITEIQAVISDRVGMKACWREVLKRNGWTDELFDDWWVSTSEQKLENYLGQNSTNRTEGSSRKSHLPFMLPLAAVLGSFVGNLLVILIFRLLKIS